MTVISALISQKGIAVATDSLRTAVDRNGSNVYLNWRRPKIVCVRRLKACVSYWGFDGLLKKIPDHIKREKPEWQFSLYDWLQNQSSNHNSASLEDFSKILQENLIRKLDELNLPKSSTGIGLHITGYEPVAGYWIPELFLISNFKDPTYTEIEEIKLSRNTYHTISKDPHVGEHGKTEYRIAVHKHLATGRIIAYNNGDPAMFNTVSSTIFLTFNLAKERGVLKPIDTLQDTLALVRRPLEIISAVQKDFYKSDRRLVGGRIHDLCIDKDGNLYSTTGVK